MVARRFIGYHDPETLPVKRGDTVTIIKGVTVRTVYHGTKSAGRTYRVKVDHVLPGMERDGNVIMNPRIVWAGTGGYWSEVDINDVPEAEVPHDR